MFTDAPTRWRRGAPSILVLLLTAVAALYACADMTAIPEDSDPAMTAGDMEVEPAEVVVGIGHTIQLRATLRNGRGEPIQRGVDSWSSDDASIASVDDEGLVTANSVGTTQVTAAASKSNKGGGRDDAPGQAKKKSKIIVSEDVVATVEVVPAAVSLAAGETTQLEAITRDESGNVLTNRYVEWSSSNNQVAAVDNSGRITTGSAGTATVTATSEGQHGNATVTVTVRTIVDIAVWPVDVSLEAGQRVQYYMAVKWNDGASECDDSSASTDPSVLYNLAAYPAACDSAIAQLGR